MATNNGDWTWSAARRDYYRAIWENGEYRYTWFRPPREPSSRLHGDYRVQPANFFVFGRVFTTLHTESLGETTDRTYPISGVTEVSFGELAHSGIRRFIVVQQMRRFCYACPVYTYGGRATTKPGVDPQAHAIVVVRGQTPMLVPGEQALRKVPITIDPASREIRLSRPSRINFGIHYPIQNNVKVKDLGMVSQESRRYLYEHWIAERGEADVYHGGQLVQEEVDDDDDDDDDDNEEEEDEVDDEEDNEEDGEEDYEEDDESDSTKERDEDIDSDEDEREDVLMHD